MSRWIIASLLFFEITVYGFFCMADCVPGESGGTWVKQGETYTCIPSASECSHWVGGLQGHFLYSQEISGNIKKRYLNYNSPCVASFEDRCPYLGGTKPSPLNWGNPVIWTYYMWTYLWVCDDDQCPDDPNKTEPGICGCGVPETDGDSDGIIDCVEKKQNEGPPIEASPPSCQSILHDE